MPNESVGSLEKVMEILGSACADCEERRYSIPGIYDHVTYRKGSVVFHCSNTGSRKNRNHRLIYRISKGIMPKEDDFEMLERELMGTWRMGYTERKYAIGALKRKMEVYAALADKDFEYGMEFMDEDGNPCSAYVKGNEVRFSV